MERIGKAQLLRYKNKQVSHKQYLVGILLRFIQDVFKQIYRISDNFIFQFCRGSSGDCYTPPPLQLLVLGNFKMTSRYFSFSTFAFGKTYHGTNSHYLYVIIKLAFGKRLEDNEVADDEDYSDDDLSFSSSYNRTAQARH